MSSRATAESSELQIKMHSWTDLVSGKGENTDIFFDKFHVGSQVEQVAEKHNLPLKNSKKRTRNFNVNEDKLLVMAWLEVSLDAVQCTDQNRATYWQQIHDYYHEHKNFESERNINSPSHHWGVIHKSVNIFCGWYTQVHNRKPSGLTEHDKIQPAMDIYQANDREGKAFTLMHCWNLLRHEHKWLELQSETSHSAQKKQKTSSTTTPRSFAPGTHESQHYGEEKELSHTSPRKGRPDGKKKEKERRGKNLNFELENLYKDAMENFWAKKEKADEMRELKKKERNDERLTVETRRLEVKEQVEHRKLDLMQEEIEMKRRVEDEKVMSMDLIGMTEQQRLFYTGLQDEIIARRTGGGK